MKNEIKKTDTSTVEAQAFSLEKLSNDELIRFQSSVATEAAKRAAKKICEQKVAASQKINLLRDNKDFFLSLLEHSYTSCSDSNHCNGMNSTRDGGYRCSKCMLIDLFDDYIDSEYEIDVNVTISKIENDKNKQIFTINDL